MFMFYVAASVIGMAIQDVCVDQKTKYVESVPENPLQ